MDSRVGQQQFGELLRSHRMRRGVTQIQLAGLSTVSVRAIRDLEVGRASRPRRDTVRLIADGLGLTGRTRADFEAAARCATVDDIADDLPWATPPAPLDALVGREAEVAVLAELLVSGGQRLITVTGLAGVGKTRIAQEVAGVVHTDHGLPVLWSAARPATPYVRPVHPDQLTELVRAELDGPAAVAGGLAGLVGDRPTVLVLDGYEMSEVRTGRVVALLQQCRQLRVLRTARGPVEISGERMFPLAPLAVPEDRAGLRPADLVGVPSVRLLTRYVRQVRPDFALTVANADAVATLCRRLDGIPAALEVAASWFLVYDAHELVDYLQADPAGFAVGRLPELRDLLQRTMSDLDAVESSALGRLTEVETGWSMSEAAGLTGVPAAVCARLVRRLLLLGLVRPAGEAGRARFRALDLVRTLYRASGLGLPVTVRAA